MVKIFGYWVWLKDTRTPTQKIPIEGSHGEKKLYLIMNHPPHNCLPRIRAASMVTAF
jgi:hypothetical protein